MGTVILTEVFVKKRRKWRIMLFSLVMVMLGMLSAFVLLFKNFESEMEKIVNEEKEDLMLLNEFRVKQSIYDVLRKQGMSLGQGMDIADAVVLYCKEEKVPVQLVLAIMSKESSFQINARSERGAMGLMQIHPITWNEYVEKMKLDVSKNAAFDPVVNVKVAIKVIKDLYEYFNDGKRSEKEVWSLVLGSYYAGRTDVVNNGLKDSHRRYIRDVEKRSKTFRIEG